MASPEATVAIFALLLNRPWKLCRHRCMPARQGEVRGRQGRRRHHGDGHRSGEL